MRNPNIKVLTNVLPDDLVHYIDKFFKYPKKKKNVPISASLQKEIQKIQSSPKFKTSMYMYGLEDFCLD